MIYVQLTKEKFIEYTLNQKWRWAGHIARMKDNRWTKLCRVATKERKEIKRMTKQKMARRHNKEWGESPGTGEQQTEDNGRH